MHRLLASQGARQGRPPRNAAVLGGTAYHGMCRRYNTAGAAGHHHVAGITKSQVMGHNGCGYSDASSNTRPVPSAPQPRSALLHGLNAYANFLMVRRVVDHDASRRVI